MIAANTETKTNASNEVELSDKYTISIEAFKQNFDSGVWDFCEEDFYIRKSIPVAHIEKKKQDLLIYDVNNDTKYVKVLESLTFYKSLNGEKFHLINGNERAKALLEMLEDKENYTDVEFKDVPYQILLTPIDDTIALQYQALSNDTTASHNVMDLAEKAIHYREVRQIFYKKSGIGTQESKSKAMEDVKRVLGGKSNGYITHLTVIATAPRWLKAMVETGEISPTTIRELIDRTKKYCKAIGVDYEADDKAALLNHTSGVRTLAISKGKYVDESSNIVKIDPVDVEEYFNTFVDKAKGKATTDNSDGSQGSDGNGEDVKINTIADLISNGLIEDEAVDYAKNLVQDQGIDEANFVKSVRASFNDVHKKVGLDTVKNLAEKFTKKSASLDDVVSLRDKVLLEINNQDVASLLENPHVNPVLADVTTDSIKLLGLMAKNYSSNDSKRLYNGIRALLIEVLPDIDVVFPEAKTDANTIFKALTSLSQNLIATDKKMNGAVEPEPEVIENTGNVAEVINTDTEEVVEPEAITVEDENFVVTVE